MLWLNSSQAVHVMEGWIYDILLSIMCDFFLQFLFVFPLGEEKKIEGLISGHKVPWVIQLELFVYFILPIQEEFD